MKKMDDKREMLEQEKQKDDKEKKEFEVGVISQTSQPSRRQAFGAVRLPRKEFSKPFLSQVWKHFFFSRQWIFGIGLLSLLLLVLFFQATFFPKAKSKVEPQTLVSEEEKYTHRLQSCRGKGFVVSQEAEEKRLFLPDETIAFERRVNSGRFRMGSEKKVLLSKGYESPVTEVLLTKGIWVWSTEVTWKQYVSLMGVESVAEPDCGEHCPVVGVDWFDAVAFANRLSKYVGFPECMKCYQKDKARRHCERITKFCLGYRLLTEAEWEYAARAGLETARYGKPVDIGWSRGNSKGKEQATFLKCPNQWGLFGMLGGVWEWCEDHFKENHMGRVVEDPVRVSNRFSRVLRGGSWKNSDHMMRFSVRQSAAPVEKRDNIGFRVARYFD